MTLSITFYDNIKYHRQDFINRDADFYGNGVVQATHFPYTLNTPADMNINIGAGVAWVDGYRIQNDSNNIALTVSTADATNPRIDIVQVGHDDINSQAVLQIKTGVAAASPTEPSADPNYVKLYAINVAANATSITSSNITDRRTLVPLNVSATQIVSGGSAGTGQTNNFTQTQTFSDAPAPINITSLTQLPAVAAKDTMVVVNNMWYRSDGTQWIAMASPAPANATTTSAGIVEIADTPSGAVPVAITTDNGAYKAINGGTFVKAGAGISVTAGTNSETVAVSPATASTIGGVKVGTGVSVQSDGTIALTAATTSTIGGVKIGNGVSVQLDGTITMNVFNHLSYWIQ